MAYLFSAVDDILGVCQAVDTGTADHRVMSRGSVGHLHGAELQKGLSQCHTTEQHLPVGNQHMNMKNIHLCMCLRCMSYCVRCVHVPVAHVTGTVFVSGATSAAPDAIDVLVTLRRVLCKIYASSKHATNICMTLIESFMDDGIYERRS